MRGSASHAQHGFEGIRSRHPTHTSRRASPTTIVVLVKMIRLTGSSSLEELNRTVEVINVLVPKSAFNPYRTIYRGVTRSLYR